MRCPGTFGDWGGMDQSHLNIQSPAEGTIFEGAENIRR